MPGECVQVHLEKTKELYWTALLEGEPEIDKTKLDTTRNIAEFDDQTQADFQKVMYDHHQKLQGKPTSDEQVCFQIILLRDRSLFIEGLVSKRNGFGKRNFLR